MNNIKDIEEKMEIKGAKCPQCGKVTIKKYRPFCSKRCSDIDLGKWLNGSYVIETEEFASEDISDS